MKSLVAVVLVLSTLVGCNNQEPSTGVVIRFDDITARSGVAMRHDAARTARKYMPEIMGPGLAAFDANGDGNVDLLCLQAGHVPGGEPRVRPAASDVNSGPTLWFGRGDGTFLEVSSRRLPRVTPYALGVTAADADGDGDIDLFLVCLGNDMLWLNQGDGTFTDHTVEAGIVDDDYGHAACWFDADADGDLDIYVANYVRFTVKDHRDCGDPSKGRVSYCHPDALPAVPDRLWRNKGGGRFEDATEELGFRETTGKGLGVVSGDFDLNGVPDVYVANDSTPNFLWTRGADGRYHEVAMLHGCALNEDGRTEAGMGVAVGDANGDGRWDLFVTNLTRESNALYLGTASDDFDYASGTSGLHVISWRWVGFGCDFADYDLDGDLDLHVVNGHVVDDPELTDDSVPFLQPGQILMNDGKGRFTEVDARSLGGLGEPALGRGTATLDVDNDGKLDVAIAANDGPVRIFRNDSLTPHAWLGIVLRGKGPNTSAVGARVTISCDGRTQMREVRAGGSYGSSHDRRLHFGLGRQSADVLVAIQWPNGQQSTAHLRPNAYHTVNQP